MMNESHFALDWFCTFVFLILAISRFSVSRCRDMSSSLLYIVFALMCLPMFFTIL
jgi:hypothetical protein